VPAKYGAEAAVDPEQAFTAALSACHMLWFLDLAARAGYSASAYHDEAEGALEAGPSGRPMITRVTLRPRVRFSGAPRPSEAEIAELHHRAHEACFIANSVLTKVSVEPQADAPDDAPAPSAGAPPAPPGP